MPELRIVGNTIEMDGEPVADIRFMPATWREDFDDLINAAKLPEDDLVDFYDD